MFSTLLPKLLKLYNLQPHHMHDLYCSGSFGFIYRSSPHKDDLGDYQITDKGVLHKPLLGRSTFYQTLFWGYIHVCVHKYGSHNVDSTLTNLISGSTHVYVLWPCYGVHYRYSHHIVKISTFTLTCGQNWS